MHTKIHSSPADQASLLWPETWCRLSCVFLMLQQRQRDERWGGGGEQEQQKAGRKDVAVLNMTLPVNLKHYHKKKKHDTFFLFWPFIMCMYIYFFSILENIRIHKIFSIRRLWLVDLIRSWGVLIHTILPLYWAEHKQPDTKPSAFFLFLVSSSDSSILQCNMLHLKL